MFESRSEILIARKFWIVYEASANCSEITVFSIQGLKILLHVSKIGRSCTWSELGWLWEYCSSVGSAELN